MPLTEQGGPPFIESSEPRQLIEALTLGNLPDLFKDLRSVRRVIAGGDLDEPSFEHGDCLHWGIRMLMGRSEACPKTLQGITGKVGQKFRAGPARIKPQPCYARFTSDPGDGCLRSLLLQ